MTLPDPFAVLGLPEAFDVDLPKLEKTHRELSRALHPDRYTNAPAGERKAALERAVQVNEAFRAVRDPLTRAEALFTKHGIAIGDGHEPKASPAFLMDVLEKREALSDAKDAKNLATVRALGEEAEAGVSRVERALAQAFAEGTRDTLQEKLGLLGELRFFRRFADEVSAVEEELIDAS